MADRSARPLVLGAARVAVGVVLGGVLAVSALPVALLLAASGGERTRRALGWAVALDRRRLRRWCGHDGEPGPLRPRPAASYLVLRTVTGAAGLLLIALGLAVAVGYLAVPPVLVLTDGLPTGSLLVSLGVGVVALLLTAQVVAASAALEGALCARLLDVEPTATLRRRVHDLVAGRAEVVAAVDDERRRIERDLHDGVQQRLVALAMLLGRARHTADPERADALHEQAHRDVLAAVAELREVVHRVFPAELDGAGLPAALESLVDRCPADARLRLELGRPLAPAVAIAVYFVVSEALTNAVKHADARTVAVEVVDDGRDVTASVRDDGPGGADPAGRGLAGLAGRLAALDGRLVVHSPAGGPTVVTAEIPCG